MEKIDVSQYKKFKRLTLVEEIKSILQKYPDDGQIFKEIVQNADDAGATKLVFIYDENDYRECSTNFSSPGLGKLQGPALYSYNDAYFTQSDWDGIRSLGLSNKIKDPLKVGRFGLGFKSVFHLTDLPTISSKTIFAYLDPIAKTFTDELEFLDFSNLDDKSKFKNYSDFDPFKQLPTYSLDGNGRCDGTLFRFPLRQEKSDISSVSYDNTRFMKLINTFMNDGYMNLLFLKNIQSIKFYKIRSGNKQMEELYSVNISQRCVQQYGQQRKAFIDRLTNQVQQGNFQELTLNHQVDIGEDSRGKKTSYSFMLSEYFGYTKTGDDFYEMITDEELSYIPLVAVAMPLDSSDGGHIFCGLPLPLREKRMTGLPVHVNGFFALGPDRKDLKWKTISSAESNDKSVNWNLCLINILLPMAYFNLIKHLIAANDANIVYKCWPNHDEVNHKWESFLIELYQKLRNVPCIYITSTKKWAHVHNVSFLKENLFASVNQYLAVSGFLKNIDANVAHVPDHILKSVSDFITFVNKDIVIYHLQENYNLFHNISTDQQCHILAFSIQDTNDLKALNGVPIICKVDESYNSIYYETKSTCVYIPTRDHPKEILPSLVNTLDTSFFAVDMEFFSRLQEIAASGKFNLILMDDVTTSIRAVKDNLPQEWLSKNDKVCWPDRSNYPTKDWPASLLAHRQRNNISFGLLDGVPLVPVVEGNQRYLCKLSTAPLVMSSNHMGGCILYNTGQTVDPSTKLFLQNCGILFVAENFIDSGIIRDLCNAGKILLPDANGVITSIENLYNSGYGQKVINSVEVSSEDQKTRLMEAIGACGRSLPRVIYQLKLLKPYGSSSYVPIGNCVLVDSSCVPTVWSAAFGNLIAQESLSHQLYEKLKNSLTTWNFEHIVNCVLQNINRLNVAQKDELFNFCVQQISSRKMSSSFVNNLKQHLYVLSDGARIKPCKLFERTQQFQELFWGQKNKFPDAKYNNNALKSLGLKTRLDQVSSQDIVNNICNIQNLESCSEDDVIKKVLQILRISRNNRIDISSCNAVNWIPIKTKKPRSYPLGLNWLGSNESGTKLCVKPPNSIVGQEFLHLIGSQLYVAQSSISPYLENVTVIPQVLTIINHLEVLVNSYNSDEKGLYKNLAYLIYRYLGQCDYREVVNCLVRNKIKIWQGKRFVNREDILLKETRVGVSPYYHYLPNDFPCSFKKILATCENSSMDEESIYIDVLTRMKEKREEENKDASKDLDLAVRLVYDLADQLDSLSDEQKKKINVPVNSKVLKLSPLEECFYHDFDGSISFNSMLSYNVLHPNIEESVADKLGIPDLTSKVLSAEDSSMFESWGQHEDLTLRLNKLLKDYEDGMAIPKELIQNADDAGASEVCFLYDQRENEDLRSKLFDRNMKVWQGPALWVYNNAVFKEADFKNITKLNAGTKEYDNSKIGKFGLGFNAVYHLTDVPSFLSGDSMVVFDPHTNFLGRAIKNTSSPGLRVCLSSTKKDLAHFQDQFKVFHGIFGVHSDFENNDVKHYNATLFRLPLRKYEQAQTSKIKNMEYTNGEMNLLFDKFKEYLDHLLLFTENVRSVKVYQLDKAVANPSEMKLLFQVQRQDTTPNSKSVMKYADSILKQMNPAFSYDIPHYGLTDVMVITVTKGKKIVERKWISSSCIGGRKSFRHASKNKGFNPCGGVACEYYVEDNKTAKVVTDLEQRFIYCFLPLPEISQLPVHINGAFEVSNDRKQLSKSTNYQKRHGAATDWNDLLGYDVGQAYFNLLLKIRSMFPNIELKEWLKLFPTVSALSGCRSAVLETLKSLIYQILNTKEAIFPVTNGWVKWEHIKLVSSNFGSPLSIDTVSCLNWYYNLTGRKNVCAQLPSTFLSLLISLGYRKNVHDHTVSQDDFFRVFFEHIDNPSLDQSLRNKIVLYCLGRKQDTGLIKDFLCTKKCVPTKPNGRMRLPCELIQERSKAAVLYDVDEDVFPQNEFGSHASYLQCLGMASNSLSWEKIADRAKVIEYSGVSKGIIYAVERSRKLISFISDSLRKIPPSPEMLEAMKNTSFVPLKQKETTSIFSKWLNDDYAFGAPNQLFTSKYVNLACCSSLICDKEYDDLLHNLNIRNIPRYEVVKEQIIQLISAYETDRSKGVDACRILDEMYRYLDTLKNIPFGELTLLKLIYSKDHEPIFPRQAYFKIEHEITGYSYKLPNNLMKYFPDLMRKLGVMVECSEREYIDLLLNLKFKFQDRSLPNELLKQILYKIVPYLCNGKCGKGAKIYLPDRTGVLRLVGDMCFKDAYWIPYENNVHYSHEEISDSCCKRVGIKPSRSVYFQRNSVGIPFGQHVDLTTRIKILLKGYSDTEDVLKEILQNADDAGATEVNLTLDMRNHGTEKIFSDKWKEMQGPALLVSNNGVFTQQDLSAIQALGQGSKCKEPLKTGKYGVGFNAVYGITDCPSFLTAIEDDHSDALVIFDPNLRYVEGATEIEPGILLKNGRQELEEKYTDVKSAYLIDEHDSEGKTLFRFPLRNKVMAKTSKISNKETNQKEVQEMLSNLKKHAPAMLIFLRNIKSLSFKYITNQGEVTEENFNAWVYGVTEKKRKYFISCQKTLARQLGNVRWVTEFTISLPYKVCVQHKSKDGTFVYHFDVIEQCGFDNMRKLDTSIIKMIETNELCLIPKGAIASISSETECERCENVKKKTTGTTETNFHNVFCTLPIPISSGLNVLINGHFILDYETRRNLWSNESPTLERKWNNAILLHCVLPSYLTYLRTKANELSVCSKGFHDIEVINHKIERFYDLFPHYVDDKNNTDYWNILNMRFYKHIYEHNVPLLIVFKIADGDLLFCKPRDDFLVFTNPDQLNYSECGSERTFYRPSILQILQQIHIRADILPKVIADNFDRCNAQLTEGSPAIIRGKLIELEKDILPNWETNRNVKQTAFKSAKNVITVLSYCLLDTKGINEADVLEGLPLCLLANEDLVSFSHQHPKYFTNHNKIFKKEEHGFTHQEVNQTVLDAKLSWMKITCFKEFNIDEFVLLLHGFLHKDTYCNSQTPIEISKPVTEYWLSLVWRFLISLASQNADFDLVLKKVENWSLILAEIDRKSYLIPINKRKGVLNSANYSAHIGRHVITVLKNVFQPATIYTKMTRLPTDLFGSVNKSTDVIDALTLTHNSGISLASIGNVVLSYLQSMYKSIDSHYASNLKRLPLFEQWNGDMTSVTVKVCVLPFGVPFNTLERFEKGGNCIILKRNMEVEKLYKHLGFVICEFVSFYQNYVFPLISSLSDDAIYEHMAAVRDYFESHPKLTHEAHNFERTISSLKFIRNSEGQKKSPNELFDPKHDIFKLVYGNKYFPDDIYQTPDWLKFLRIVGLISAISQELFLQFAKNVEHINREESLLISKLLCGELFVKPCFRNVHFLNKIKSISFIIPDKLNKKWEKIHPSRNSTLNRICFEQSVRQSDAILVWTTKTILPSYATPAFQFDETEVDYAAILGVKKARLDCCQDILNHIRNITETDMEKKTSSCKILDQETSETFVNVLTSFYEYLRTGECIDKRNISFLKSISFILVDKDLKIDKIDKAVFSSERIITPYINSIDVKHGKYFETFTLLGCSYHPNARQYCALLKEVKTEFGAKKLDVNNLIVVKKAVVFLSTVLVRTKDDSLTSTSLYLPTTSFNSKDVCLTLSTKTIFVDDLKYENRLQNFSEPILIPKYDDVEMNQNVDVNVNLLKNLPKDLKPKVLSKVIEERLTSELHVVDVSKNHISKKIEERLQSDQFLACFMRLLKHEANEDFNNSDVNKGLLEKKGEEIFTALQKVKVIVLSNIQTQYAYKNDLIPDSIVEKSLFLKKNKDWLEIYFKESQRETTLMYSQISTALLELFSNPLKKTLLLVPILLHTSLSDLSSVLDGEGIFRQESDSQFLKSGQIPTPGDLVPLELYCLLKYDLLDFEKDEYVAVEREENGRCVYIYGIIRRVDRNADKLLRVYGVQISANENDIVDVKTTDLYKFDSTATVIPTEDTSLILSDAAPSCDGPLLQNEDEGRTFAEICEEIIKILNDIKSLSEEEKKKVIRRLYLKWHPDKHPENSKELATEVFKFLQNEIEKINGNHSQFFQSWNRRAEKESKSYEDYFFNFHRSYRSSAFSSERRNDRRSSGRAGFYNHNDHGSSAKGDSRANDSGNGRDGFGRDVGGSSGYRSNCFRGNGGFAGGSSNSAGSSGRFEPKRSKGLESSELRGRRSGNFFFTPPTFQRRNPQPSESSRWFKQAQFDISSAENDNTNSYEWICYKAYQASFKALKAARYCIDYTEIEETPSLATIAETVDDEALKSLATKLETLLGSSSEMQYPARRNFDVPHDRYNKQKSEKAMAITKQILLIVEQMIKF
ncbi:sacsin-like [Hydractinia symbiolongicarpus]|uniref:sacsin-like n=1 Tax=Hydractinia symbiolongicarpus TaxID=13093 RepID=UPI00254F166E|nr:sacsin-like [Hydractinia symbiolongicarpus]